MPAARQTQGPFFLPNTPIGQSLTAVATLAAVALFVVVHWAVCGIGTTMRVSPSERGRAQQ